MRPVPGSWEALAAGCVCTCTYDLYAWIVGGDSYDNSDCPVHRIPYKPNPECVQCRGRGHYLYLRPRAGIAPAIIKVTCQCAR